MPRAELDPNQRWKLPPLILSPFAEPSANERLLAGSRAGLMLEGFLPPEVSPEQLTRRVLDARYAELMMLYYIGKDVIRWAAQCLEFAELTQPLRGRGISLQSFLGLLIEATPEPVSRKLRKWGVFEYRNIFARAVGLHAVFETAPPREVLAPDFLRHYHRFADHMYACGQQLGAFSELDPVNFEFELYASGEYSRKLEQEWGAGS